MVDFSPTYLTDAFEFHSTRRHRTVIVLIGPETKQYIPLLHERLTKISQLNDIIWCYKNSETAVDSISKKQKPNDADDAVQKWLKIHTPDHILYKESHRILGRTCDMLVLQDFEMLMPNTLVTAMESVRGGGLILFLLDQAKTLAQIIETRNELHAQNGATDGAKLDHLFNRRLFKSLSTTPNCIFLDYKMRIMSITRHYQTTPIPEEVQSSFEVSPGYRMEQPTTSVDLLAQICKTKDQSEALQKCIRAIDSTDPALLQITAPRGRGKTALLGLTAAFAVHSSAESVFITALYPDNIQTFFEYLIQSLQRLGYKKQDDYKVCYIFLGKKRQVGSIELVKTKRYIKYITPLEAIENKHSILFVDEAATLPLSYIKKMAQSRKVFLSTTLGGYEGTGRAFKTKLSEYFAKTKSNITSVSLATPIRYGKNDPTELWLNKALLLDPQLRSVKERPLPSDSEFFHVNKHALFSGSDATEEILAEIFAVLAFSHYRNNPNDLQILADCKNHEMFVLLSPSGRVVASIQIAFEGLLDMRSSKREGNLIPWVIYENFNSKEFAMLQGARVVRIAVHPHLLSMGYGIEALRRLETWLAGSEGQEHENVLFNEHKSMPPTSWMGSSFGVTEQLHRFWKRAGYEVVCIKQEPSSTTGEYSAIVLKESSLSASFSTEFKKRFLTLLGYSFKELSPTLCLSLIHPMKRFGAPTGLDTEDIQRLALFVQGLISIRCVLDLMPALARLSVGSSDLTVLQQSVLIMLGLQHYMPEYIAKYLTIEEYQLEGLIRKIVEIFFNNNKK